MSLPASVFPITASQSFELRFRQNRHFGARLPRLQTIAVMSPIATFAQGMIPSPYESQT